MESTPSTMEHLRDTTRGLHKEAESRPLQRSMARGTLPRGAYAMYLGQLRHLHAALEEGLDAAISFAPALAPLHTENRRRVPDLDRDLLTFGVQSPSVPVLPPTERFVDRIRHLSSEEPIALLGPLYVLEGSTNGGKFLAKVLRSSLLLENGDGIAYMDPYGDEQPRMWASFKRLADEIPLDSEQLEAVSEAARWTFEAIAAISDAILPPEAGAQEA
jgi:heme oxygenase